MKGVLLVGFLLLLAGTVTAQDVGTRCAEGSYNCYEGSVAVCQNGEYVKYDTASDYYRKYCGAQTTCGEGTYTCDQYSVTVCLNGEYQKFGTDSDYYIKYCQTRRVTCREGTYTCDQYSVTVCQNGEYQKYDTASDYYAKYCAPRVDPAPIESCAGYCEREFKDEYQARLCIQAKCEGQEISCKDQCYLSEGPNGYQDCYRKRCETRSDTGSSCEERCRQKAWITVSATVANAKTVGINEAVFARCLREECEARDDGDNDAFCGSSTYGKCETDADCTSGGCSGQLCQSRSEESRATTCEARQCYNAGNYGLGCGCVKNQCQWARQTPIELPPDDCKDKCRREYGKYPEKLEYCVRECRGYVPPTRGECDDGAVKVMVCSGGNWNPVFEQPPYCSGVKVPPRPMPVQPTTAGTSSGGEGKGTPMPRTEPMKPMEPTRPVEKFGEPCREGWYKCYPEERTVVYCRAGEMVRSQDPKEFEMGCGRRNIVQAVVSAFTGEKECKEGEFRCYDESRKAEVCANGSWQGGGADLFAKVCVDTAA
ncbi:MAG: eight-cysteine-cluster domain-containing protein [Candidatus Diapherotrites archaeon]|uniref:Eight-cysteine-cluster domain-containing protein n=1 Tax=Candidatus Iainarchaeum sp. TaxID=3101447 RepID=A0A8T4LIY0_9ARCH|nr:eight-cysteine-cluster domain-containing protein [Candidatus Diapherotrites archaeon]